MVRTRVCLVYGREYRHSTAKAWLCMILRSTTTTTMITLLSLLVQSSLKVSLYAVPFLTDVSYYCAYRSSTAKQERNTRSGLAVCGEEARGAGCGGERTEGPGQKVKQRLAQGGQSRR